MTLESTLAALLREQRETNALLRRLVEAKTGVAVQPAHITRSVAGFPGGSRTVTADDPEAPTTVWANTLPPGTSFTPTCESPATRGDGGTIRVGWRGNGMVGP